MLPNADPKNNVTSWDDFKARKAAKETSENIEAQLEESIKQASAVKPAPRPRRKPNTVAESKLGDVLRHAVQLAISRRRASREDIAREQVLLEVLTDALRRSGI